MSADSVLDLHSTGLEVPHDHGRLYARSNYNRRSCLAEIAALNNQLSGIGQNRAAFGDVDDMAARHRDFRIPLHPRHVPGIGPEVAVDKLRGAIGPGRRQYRRIRVADEAGELAVGHLDSNRLDLIDLHAGPAAIRANSRKLAVTGPGRCGYEVVRYLRRVDKGVQNVLPVSPAKDKGFQVVLHVPRDVTLALYIRRMTAPLPLVRIEMDIFDAADIGCGVDEDTAAKHTAKDVPDEVDLAERLADFDSLVGVDKGDVFDRVIHSNAMNRPGIGDDVVRRFLGPDHRKTSDRAALLQLHGRRTIFPTPPAGDEKR